MIILVIISIFSEWKSYDWIWCFLVCVCVCVFFLFIYFKISALKIVVNLTPISSKFKSYI